MDSLRDLVIAGRYRKLNDLLVPMEYYRRLARTSQDEARILLNQKIQD